MSDETPSITALSAAENCAINLACYTERLASFWRRPGRRRSESGEIPLEDTGGEIGRLFREWIDLHYPCQLQLRTVHAGLVEVAGTWHASAFDGVLLLALRLLARWRGEADTLSLNAIPDIPDGQLTALVKQEFARLRASLAGPAVAVSRLRIEGAEIHLDGKKVVLGMTPDRCEDAACYLRHLLDARGDYISDSDVTAAEEKRVGGRPGVRWDRLRKALPSELRDLIETKRNVGSRLRPAVWRNQSIPSP